jgi:hypothetical protein
MKALPMGLFDFFRRKRSEPSIEEMMNLVGGKPRDLHYFFAHYALRELAHHDSTGTVATLYSSDAKAFLNRVLEMVVNVNKIARLDFTAEDIGIHTGKFGRHSYVILEMPPPQAPTEAHFIALILVIAEDATYESARHAPLHYFTLEQGITLGTPRTTFAEWTADGTHANMGDGPSPDVESFRAFLAQRFTA